jgi:hypothetical protein
MFFTQALQAQSGACEQLKLSLAARIDPSIRGYALEIASAGEPVPAGAKVIGTCEGGARRILFRRGGGAQPVNEAVKAPKEVPAPMPNPMPAPVVPSNAAPVETKGKGVAIQPDPAPQVVATALPASRPEPPPAIEAPAPSIAVPVAEVRADTQESNPGIPLAQRAMELLRRQWHWVAMLVLAMLGASLWAWLAHRSAYDEAGLPRGPKLN